MAHEAMQRNLFHATVSRKCGRLFSDATKAEMEFRQFLPRMKQRHIVLQLESEIRFFSLCGPDHVAVIMKGGLVLAYHRDDPSEPVSVLTTASERGLFMHYNHWTQSMMIFYASAIDFPERTLRVRVIELACIVNDSWRDRTRKPIAPQLQNLVLPYPGFFDLSTADHVFLVWNELKGTSNRRHMAAYCLKTYTFAFHVSDSGQDTDFRFTRESVTMLRVKLMRAPDSEEAPICAHGAPLLPGTEVSPPVHISINHLDKVSGTRLHTPVHLRFLKNQGKIIFLEEYNGFLLIKQEFGNLLVIDMTGWVRHKKLIGNCVMHPCKSWFPKNVAYMTEANRFACLVGDELQVWRLGPDLGTFGCIFHIPPVSYSLQNIRMFGVEHGVFFFMRQSNVLGSYGEIRSFTDDCSLMGTITDDSCTTNITPFCYCTPSTHLLVKFCPLRREMYISYGNVVYSYASSGM